MIPRTGRRSNLPRGVLLAASLVIMLATACVRREISSVDVTPDRMGATSEIRSATNLPQQFIILTPAATAGDCPPQLRDPELRATLQLRRSVLRELADSAAYRAIGDYSVDPPGLYGEAPGEGLRVDCARLSAIGVVRL